MKNNQLRMGLKVEKEHKKTIGFIKSYVKKNKTFPTNKIIFQSIAKDHLKEDKRYYSKLKKAKL
jgi:sulfur relay (sulfurtransferase) DsrC/TusE family protein